MARETIQQEILDVMEQTLCCEAKALTPLANLRDDLGMDSLDLVELTMALEEEILEDEPIDEAVAEEWRTVKDVLDTVMELAALGHPARK